MNHHQAHVTEYGEHMYRVRLMLEGSYIAMLGVMLHFAMITGEGGLNVAGVIVRFYTGI